MMLITCENMRPSVSLQTAEFDAISLRLGISGVYDKDWTAVVVSTLLC